MQTLVPLRLALTRVALVDVDGAAVRMTYGTSRGSGLALPRASDAVLVRPIEALEPDTTYTVTIEGKADGVAFARTWRFGTKRAK